MRIQQQNFHSTHSEQVNDHSNTQQTQNWKDTNIYRSHRRRCQQDSRAFGECADVLEKTKHKLSAVEFIHNILPPANSTQASSLT